MNQGQASALASVECNRAVLRFGLLCATVALMCLWAGMAEAQSTCTGNAWDSFFCGGSRPGEGTQNGPSGPSNGGAQGNHCRQTLDQIAGLAAERDREVNARTGYALNAQLKEIGEARFGLGTLRQDGLPDRHMITHKHHTSALVDKTRAIAQYYRKWQLRNPYQIEEAEHIFNLYLSPSTPVFDANGAQAALRELEGATHTAKAFLLHASNEFYCLGIVKYDRLLSTLTDQSLPRNCPAQQVDFYKSDVTQLYARAIICPSSAGTYLFPTVIS